MSIVFSGRRLSQQFASLMARAGVTASRSAVILPAARRFGRAAEAKQEEMLALDIGQHERVRDPIEHVGRGAPPRLVRAMCASSG
jgi:hypothetical protein